MSPILNLQSDFLVHLLPDQIECVFCFDCYGQMVQNFYIKDREKIPNIRESFSAVSISERKSEGVVPGRNQADVMASLCLNMVEINPEVWKYFRFYIGKGVKENLVNINVLASANVPFLIFSPPSHPSHAFLGLLDVEESKNIKNEVEKSFENNKEKFKKILDDKPKQNYLIKFIKEEKEKEYLRKQRKIFIPENYEEVESIQITDTGEERFYFLRPKKIGLGFNAKRKQVTQADLSNILFYRLCVEGKSDVPSKPIFCPKIARLDSSGAGDIYKFSIYDISSSKSFLKRISEEFRLTAEDNIPLRFVVPPKPVSLFSSEFHAWPQNEDNFQGSCAGTCSYFADADIYSFGIVLYSIISQQQAQKFSFDNALEIEKNPRYQLFMFKNMLDRVSPKQDLLKIVDIKDTNKYDKNFFEIIEITEHNCLLINKTRFPLHLMPNEELFSEKLGCISEEMTIDGSIPVHLTFNTRSFFNILKNAEKEKGIDCPFNKIVLPNDNCSELMNGIVEFPGKNHYSNNSFEINIKRCDYLMKILSNLKRRTGENNKLSIIEEMLKLTLFIDQQSYSQYTNKNHNILEKFKTINQEVLTIYKELTKKTKEFSELSIYKFEKQLLKFTSTEEMNKLTNDKIDNIFNIIVPEAFKKITVYNQNIQNSSVKTKEKIKTDISSQNFRYYQKKEDLKVSPDLTNKLNLVPTKTQNFKKPSSQPPPSKHLSFTQRENLRKQQRQRSGSAPAKFRS